jgi:hypothetical protein
MTERRRCFDSELCRTMIPERGRRCRYCSRAEVGAGHETRRRAMTVEIRADNTGNAGKPHMQRPRATWVCRCSPSTIDRLPHHGCLRLEIK